MGATSARKIAVSSASIWQKKSGFSRAGSVQYASRSRVTAVMPGYRAVRHAPTCSRTRLMKSLSVIRSATQSAGRLSWAPPLVLGFGIGMKYVLRRRPSAISLVIPSSSKRK